MRNGPGELWGFIDKTGVWVIEPQFFYADPFSEGLALVKSDAGYGFIDKSGTVVIQPRFDLVSDFDEGLAMVATLQEQKVTYVTVGPDEIPVFGTTVQQYDDYGYIDTTGKLVIEGGFDGAEPFSSGVAAVSAEGTWGYIDKTGAWVIEPRFDTAYAFHGDLAMVCLDGSTDSWVYIDRSGMVVWESGPGAHDSHESSAALPPMGIDDWPPPSPSPGELVIPGASGPITTDYRPTTTLAPTTTGP